MGTNFRNLLLTALITSVFAVPAFADMPPAESYQETIPVNERAAAEGSCWNANIAGGAPVYLFQEESTEVGGGVYLDIYCAGGPLNFRVGLESSHIDLDQAAAQGNAEFPGKQVKASFFRIPFSLEYVMPLDSSWTLYAGGGPDLIHTANDVSETAVGGHLSARLAYSMNEHWGLALEAGYLWAEVDSKGGGQDIDLDGTFITPSIYYTF